MIFRMCVLPFVCGCVSVNRREMRLSPLLRLWRVARRSAGLQTRSGVQRVAS